ncbi:MAG: hypothetical protein LAP21_25995, partial [Acidobacteriia bacterium]|nr:hypothetical protein [Terriglobia bacterium]
MIRKNIILATCLTLSLSAFAREAQPGDIRHEPQPGDKRGGKFAAREAQPGDIRHEPQPGDKRGGKFVAREA